MFSAQTNIYIANFTQDFSLFAKWVIFTGKWYSISVMSMFLIWNNIFLPYYYSIVLRGDLPVSQSDSY